MLLKVLAAMCYRCVQVQTMVINNYILTTKSRFLCHNGLQQLFSRHFMETTAMTAYACPWVYMYVYKYKSSSLAAVLGVFELHWSNNGSKPWHVLTRCLLTCRQRLRNDATALASVLFHRQNNTILRSAINLMCKHFLLY